MRRLALIVAAVLAGTAAPAVAQTAPSVSSPSAIVVEAGSGDVAFQRRASQKRSMASTTKMMTGLLSVEGAALDDVLTAAPYTPGPAETQIGLRAGEKMTVRDLVRALMLASANDAAVTLAVGISGSVPSFVDEMNARAKELGLRDTTYSNPVGLDQGTNRSSARDLVKLAIELRGEQFLRRTVDMPRASLTSGSRRRTVINRNTLVRTVDEVDGVKTGRTNQAGYVLVGSATRNGVTVVSAVLGAASEAARDQDTLALLRYGLRQYRRTTLVKRNATLARADLKYREQQVRLIAGRGLQRVLKRDQRASVRVVGAPAELDGPLTAGSRVGTVEARVGDEVVGRVPLVTATAVEEAGLSTRLEALLRESSTLLLIAGLLICTVSLVLLRRRVVRRGARA